MCSERLDIIWKVSTEEEVADVLHYTVQTVQQSLARSRDILFEARKSRPRPHLDDKILTAWNGLMISAFARAYQVTRKPEYIAAARKAIEFVKRELYVDGVLIRNYRHGRSSIRAFADDYAFVITALLDLYEATFEPKWLQWATELQGKMDTLFWDESKGGYFSAEKDDPFHVMRQKEDYDGAEPSPVRFVSVVSFLKLIAETVAFRTLSLP